MRGDAAVKYTDPKMRIANFDSIIKADAEIPALMQISANCNEATESLMQKLETAAANARAVFTYKW